MLTMAGSSTSTLFVNQTGDVVKMKVGSRHSSSPIATIAASGGQFRMPVNMNDTYREFLVGVGSDDVGKSTAIITSDNCCDYQCITIQEVDGTIDLLRQPRQQQTSGTVGMQDHYITPAAPKRKPWFHWKMSI